MLLSLFFTLVVFTSGENITALSHNSDNQSSISDNNQLNHVIILILAFFFNWRYFYAFNILFLKRNTGALSVVFSWCFLGKWLEQELHISSGGSGRREEFTTTIVDGLPPPSCLQIHLPPNCGSQSHFITLCSTISSLNNHPDLMTPITTLSFA